MQVGEGSDLGDAALGLVPVRAHRGLNASETAFVVSRQRYLIAYSERIVGEQVEVSLPEFAWTRALDEVGMRILVEIVPQLDQLCVLRLLQSGLQLAPRELASSANNARPFSSGIVFKLEAGAIRKRPSSLVLRDSVQHHRAVLFSHFHSILKPFKLRDGLYLYFDGSVVIEILVVSEPESGQAGHVRTDIRLISHRGDLSSVSLPQERA